jgi:hypothetical protein
MVEQFRYFGKALKIVIPFTKKLRADLIQGMFAIIMQDLSFTSLLSKNVKIKIHRNISLPVLCGCET